MRRALYPLLLAAIVGSVPSWAETKAGPFSDVPTGDPAYAAVTQLEAEGQFTGYPAHTFDGERLLTRYEFAVAIQRLFQEATRSRSGSFAGVRSPILQAVSRFVLAQFPRKEPEQITCLSALIEEFRPEVAMLGGEPGVMLQQLKQLPAPEGVAVPPRSEDEPPPTFNGRKLARRQWDAGRVVLYTWGSTDTAHLDPLLASPLHPSYVGVDLDPITRARIEAHNDEVYRLVLERGMPPNSRIRWLSLIEHPEKAIEGAPIRMRLSPRAIACHFGELTVTVRRASTDMGRLWLHSRGWTRELEVPWSGAGTLELFGGPPESELLFLRVPGESVPYAIVDLRCGERLR